MYKVQFLSSDKKLKEGSREFKGLKDYEYYIQNGTYRYTTGSFRNVRDASTYQREIRALGFSDAFVVAFIGDRRITLQQAKEMENR